MAFAYPWDEVAWEVLPNVPRGKESMKDAGEQEAKRCDWLCKEAGEGIIWSSLRLNIHHLHSSFFLNVLLFQLHSFHKKDNLSGVLISACLIGKLRVISSGTIKSTDKIFYNIYNKCKEIDTNKTWL